MLYVFCLIKWFGCGMSLEIYRIGYILVSFWFLVVLWYILIVVWIYCCMLVWMKILGKVFVGFCVVDGSFFLWYEYESFLEFLFRKVDDKIEKINFWFKEVF